jgi:hypothetical protein
MAPQVLAEHLVGFLHHLPRLIRLPDLAAIGDRRQDRLGLGLALAIEQLGHLAAPPVGEPQPPRNFRRPSGARVTNASGLDDEAR